MPSPPMTWQEFKSRAHRKSVLSFFIVFWPMLMPLFVYAFWSTVTPGFASWFSSILKMHVDLGACSQAFASVQISHRSMMFLNAAALLGISILLAADGVMNRANFDRYAKLALAATCLGLIYLWFAVRESGAWVAPLRRFAPKIDLAEACARFQSESLLANILIQWHVAFMMSAAFLIAGAMLTNSRNLLKAGLWGKATPVPDEATHMLLAEAYAKRGLGYSGAPSRSTSENWRGSSLIFRLIAPLLMAAFAITMTALCLDSIMVVFR
jgi:hypothetical protein